MIRKTLVTLALTAGMVAGTAGIASAHECFVANRSEKGNAGADNSANWYTLHLSDLFAQGHQFLGGPALTDPQMAHALGVAAEAGVPSSFTLFEKFTIPRNLMSEEDLTGTSADGKGIDHFFYAYGEKIIGAFRAGQAYQPAQG